MNRSNHHRIAAIAAIAADFRTFIPIRRALYSRTGRESAAASSRRPSSASVTAIIAMSLDNPMHLAMPPSQANLSAFPPDCPVLVCPKQSAASTLDGRSAPAVAAAAAAVAPYLATVASVYIDLASTTRDTKYKVRRQANDATGTLQCASESELRFAPGCPVTILPEYCPPGSSRGGTVMSCLEQGAAGAENTLYFVQLPSSNASLSVPGAGVRYRPQSEDEEKHPPQEQPMDGGLSTTRHLIPEEDSCDNNNNNAIAREDRKKPPSAAPAFLKKRSSLHIQTEAKVDNGSNEGNDTKNDDNEEFKLPTKKLRPSPTNTKTSGEITQSEKAFDDRVVRRIDLLPTINHSQVRAVLVGADGSINRRMQDRLGVAVYILNLDAPASDGAASCCEVVPDFIQRWIGNTPSVVVVGNDDKVYAASKVVLHLLSEKCYDAILGTSHGKGREATKAELSLVKQMTVRALEEGLPLEASYDVGAADKEDVKKERTGISTPPPIQYKYNKQGGLSPIPTESQVHEAAAAQRAERQVKSSSHSSALMSSRKGRAWDADDRNETSNISSLTKGDGSSRGPLWTPPPGVKGVEPIRLRVKETQVDQSAGHQVCIEQPAPAKWIDNWYQTKVCYSHDAIPFFLIYKQIVGPGGSLLRKLKKELGCKEISLRGQGSSKDEGEPFSFFRISDPNCSAVDAAADHVRKLLMKASKHYEFMRAKRREEVAKEKREGKRHPHDRALALIMSKPSHDEAGFLVMRVRSPLSEDDAFDLIIGKGSAQKQGLEARLACSIGLRDYQGDKKANGLPLHVEIKAVDSDIVISAAEDIAMILDKRAADFNLRGEHRPERKSSNNRDSRYRASDAPMRGDDFSPSPAKWCHEKRMWISTVWRPINLPRKPLTFTYVKECIIGPGGSKVRDIEREYHVELSIRGEGSNSRSDRLKTDPLNVQILGTNRKSVDAAAEYVTRLLVTRLLLPGASKADSHRTSESREESRGSHSYDVFYDKYGLKQDARRLIFAEYADNKDGMWAIKVKSPLDEDSTFRLMIGEGGTSKRHYMKMLEDGASRFQIRNFSTDNKKYRTKDDPLHVLIASHDRSATERVAAAVATKLDDVFCGRSSSHY